jgi:hypothetical protein
MIKINLSYNVILGKPFLHKINLTINNRYLALTLSINNGVTTVRGGQLISKRFTSICLKGKK